MIIHKKDTIYICMITAAIEERYVEIETLLVDPDVYQDPQYAAKLSKEQKELQPIVEVWRRYNAASQEHEEALAMLEGDLDSEFKDLVSEEINSLSAEMDQLREEMRILLLPVDKDDEKSVIVEIRAGAGGEEAALFASSLYRMYTMYSDIKKYKIEVLNINETELGGIKEISFLIAGAGAYSRLKFESGVHRVQRVPDTEASGRIHTSTVTVAVLPEVEDVEVEINPADLQDRHFSVREVPEVSTSTRQNLP